MNSERLFFTTSVTKPATAVLFLAFSDWIGGKKEVNFGIRTSIATEMVDIAPIYGTETAFTFHFERNMLPSNMLLRLLIYWERGNRNMATTSYAAGEVVCSPAPHSSKNFNFYSETDKFLTPCSNDCLRRPPLHNIRYCTTWLQTIFSAALVLKGDGQCISLVDSSSAIRTGQYLSV